jgi:hypothetical protein
VQLGRNLLRAQQLLWDLWVLQLHSSLNSAESEAVRQSEKQKNADYGNRKLERRSI